MYAQAGKRLDGDAYTLDGWERSLVKKAFNILLNAEHYQAAVRAVANEIGGVGAQSRAEARDEKRLLRLQKQLAKYRLLIIDELGFVPLSKTGAELLFEVFSQRYERGSTLVTSNLPFDEWTEVFGSERLTGALLDRLTHHVHILEMNGESYRLNQSRSRQRPAAG